LVEDQIVIDCDNPWLSSDEESNSIDTGIVLLLGDESGLHELWELRNHTHRSLDVAVTSHALVDITPCWAIRSPQSCGWKPIRNFIEAAASKPYAVSVFEELQGSSCHAWPEHHVFSVEGGIRVFSV